VTQPFLLGRVLTLAVLAVVALAAAAVPAGALRSYALSAPDLTMVLPARLNEVSGVTAVSETELAMVQDEEGIVFFCDLAQRRITRQMRFGPPGDYEDITRVGSRLFVLRSDGTLFEIGGLSGTPRVKAFRLRLPTADNEGLCLDARHDCLLIAAKSELRNQRNLKDARAIFAFDPDSGTQQPQPVLLFSVDAIQAFAEQQSRQPGKTSKRLPTLHFMPSAVGIHPVTSEIFVLSAVDRVLATFDTSGLVTGYTSLDPRLFRQPEGLTFLANGDLLITNEAAGARPTLLLFKRTSADRRVGSSN
jgi:hypothetical protein